MGHLMGLVLADAVAQLLQADGEAVGKGGVGGQAGVHTLQQGGLKEGNALLCTALVPLLHPLH